MRKPPSVVYACTDETFHPCILYPVRWLEQYRDYELAQAFWPASVPLSREHWNEAHQMGYKYCGVIEQDRLVAVAAEWQNAQTSWEVAAVHTCPEYQRQGYAKTVVSFVTRRILAAGKMATCTTASGNLAMQRTAESVGFYRIEGDDRVMG